MEAINLYKITIRKDDKTEIFNVAAKDIVAACCVLTSSHWNSETSNWDESIYNDADIISAEFTDIKVYSN